VVILPVKQLALAIKKGDLKLYIWTRALLKENYIKKEIKL